MDVHNFIHNVEFCNEGKDLTLQIFDELKIGYFQQCRTCEKLWIG